jgi:hypothetical protein
MEVIIVRPKIVGGFPGLGDGVELKGMNGLRSPSGLAEMNVGSRARCSGSLPSTMRSRRAHRNMRDAHMLAEIGTIVATRAVGDLGDRHMNIRVAKPVYDSRAGEINPRCPPDRIRNRRYNMKRVIH